MKTVMTALLVFLLLFATLLHAQNTPALTPVLNFLLSSKDYGAVGSYLPVRYPNAGLHDKYVVYYPQNGITPDMPVVLFLEGGGKTPHIDNYRGIMAFMASQGYFVIGAESGEAYDSDFARRIFQGALETAKAEHGLTLSKLAVMGHSQGGGQAFYVMHYFQDPQHGDYGSDASLVLSIDGWFAFGMNQEDLAQLHGSVAFLQMHGNQGTGTDPRIHLTIWNLLHHATKTFLTLPHDDHYYISGSFEELTQNKHDILTLVGALTYDTFHHSHEGYGSISHTYKSSYSAIYNALKPEASYREGDCQGVQYNARDTMLKFYDIDYCAVDAYVLRRTNREADPIQ